MARVKLLMVLTENETLVGPRDLRGLVEMAVTAEAAGVDGVMMSEHLVLGRDSGAAGVMRNVRDYAAPGNQSPSYAWPSSLVLLSAIPGLLLLVVTPAIAATTWTWSRGRSGRAIGQPDTNPAARAGIRCWR